MSIPLTVLGGFLGAGKTTLLNHLLRSAARRWAVLVNDFGAVNVDAALIGARDGDTIALANGCLCCTMGDDMGEALGRLAARDPAPEHVVVEASGVGDPWRIAQLALIEPGFTLEPLVVLVDAAGFDRQLDDPWIADTVRRQLDHAELLLVSKADLVAAEVLEGLMARLAALRPATPIVAVRDGVVAAEVLSFAPPARPRASRLQAAMPEHPFRSWHWQPPGAVDRGRLRGVLEALPESVLRVKGVARYAPDDARLLLQYAARRWNFAAAPDIAETGLVLIGTKALPPPGALQALFDAAC